MRLIARVSLRHSLVVPRLGWASRPLAAPHLRALCTKKDGGESAIAEAKPFERDGVVVKNYGSGLVLPEVTKEQAQNSFLEATDVKRAMTPPVSVAVEARDDMLKDRFNYVSKNLNPAATYVVMGQDGKTVAPDAISGSAFAIAGALVMMAGITGVVYLRTQWGVTSPKDLGDKLRERGAARKEALEQGSGAKLVRTFSASAEQGVKANVDLVRAPSHQLGEHFKDTFQGGVGANKIKTAAAGLVPVAAAAEKPQA